MPKQFLLTVPDVEGHNTVDCQEYIRAAVLNWGLTPDLKNPLKFFNQWNRFQLKVEPMEKKSEETPEEKPEKKQPLNLSATTCKLPTQCAKCFCQIKPETFHVELTTLTSDNEILSLSRFCLECYREPVDTVIQFSELTLFKAIKAVDDLYSKPNWVEDEH